MQSILPTSLALLAFLCLNTFSAIACAQSVSLKGVSGNKALVSVNGSPPRFLKEGSRLSNVLIEKVHAQHVTFTVKGQRFNLPVGSTRADADGLVPATKKASVNTSTLSKNTRAALARHAVGKTRITLRADSDGHYKSKGLINGKTVTFLVDTGATGISLNSKAAKMLGIDYSDGKKIVSNTANGSVSGYAIILDQVSVENIKLNNVLAAVLETDNPEEADRPILLGMSFLSRVKLSSENNTLVLETSE